jgi:hypothetical protein
VLAKEHPKIRRVASNATDDQGVAILPVPGLGVDNLPVLELGAEILPQMAVADP